MPDSVFAGVLEIRAEQEESLNGSRAVIGVDEHTGAQADGVLHTVLHKGVFAGVSVAGVFSSKGRAE